MLEIDTTQLIEKINELMFSWGPKVIGALIVLIAGWIFIGILSSLFGRMMDKRKVDESLKPFVKSLVSVLLKVLLLITVAGMVGIEMTSFIAIIGAAGLAIGLALQGSLANFAGGVLILLFKPFKVGDFIEAQGMSGKVSEIQIFNTVLKTPDNKTIIMPNGPLASSNLVNFSTEPTRRVDFVFGIGYDSNIDKAKKVLQELIDADTRILDDPASAMMVSELADSSVNITVRVWAKTADYWGVYFDMLENVKKSFDKARINIPYPQMDVHQKR